MSSIIIISLIGLIILLLLFGLPVRPMRLIGNTTVKLAIGVLFLFFFNVFGGIIGLHIPINLFTIAISGFLGLFGMGSLIALHIFLL